MGFQVEKVVTIKTSWSSMVKYLDRGGAFGHGDYSAGAVYIADLRRWNKMELKAMAGRFNPHTYNQLYQAFIEVPDAQYVRFEFSPIGMEE